MFSRLSFPWPTKSLQNLPLKMSLQGVIYFKSQRRIYGGKKRKLLLREILLSIIMWFCQARCPVATWALKRTLCGSFNNQSNPSVTNFLTPKLCCWSKIISIPMLCFQYIPVSQLTLTDCTGTTCQFCITLQSAPLIILPCLRISELLSIRSHLFLPCAIYSKVSCSWI